MAKFRYSMENILRIKEKVEEQKRMELGQAMMAYQNEVAEQERINGLLQETILAFKKSQSERLVVTEFQRLNNSVNYYEVVLKEQKVLVKKALELVEVKRVNLRKALEEKKIQEKLKENALEAFMEEEKLKEQKLLDEVVSYRYASADDVE